MTVRVLIVCGGSGVNLLGQRSVLGVNAEIQIDASREIEKRATDVRSLSVPLDKGVATTGLLFQSMRDRVRPGQQPSPDGARWSDYVYDVIYREQDVQHFEFLATHSAANVPLERGLAQAPAIGGLTIRHPANRTALEQAFEKTFANVGLGPDNPVEALIVASTAGGTGEGVHRFVGAFLADYVGRRHEGTQVTLNFIRIGQLTYRSVNLRQTALNTFFGIAADAAFALKMREDPKVITRWFYVDLPDVGTGERSIRVRAQLVEMAAKAVLLEDLQDDLQRLLVNNNGIPMVLTRTGYWGRDFGEQRKYFETLRQLRDKLRKLLEPDYERFTGGDRRPEFEPEESLKDWAVRVGDPKYVQRKLDDGWSFPRPKVHGKYPQDLTEVRDLVADLKQAIENLVTESWGGVRGEWRVERVRAEGGEERREMAPLRIGITSEASFGEAVWFQRIQEAHEARAWAWHLLGCDAKGKPRPGGRDNRIQNLLAAAQSIYSKLHGFNPLKGSESKVKEAVKDLRALLALLAETDVLLALEEDARRMLEAELAGARSVMDVVESEINVVRKVFSGGGVDVVQAADLSERLEQATGKTWLQLLLDAARRGDRKEFAQVVSRGATGLTEAGLRDVLGLRPQAAISDMHQEMASRMGKMYDLDGNVYEAPWWAATPDTPSLDYQYRILPWLSPQVRASLENLREAQHAAFRYIFARMGQIGLYVLALHGISANRRPGDTESMPAYLMRPLVPQVREALAEWKEKPTPYTPSGQLRLVQAGVCGEALYLRALKAVGLTDGEIEKIGQFYTFFE